MTVLFGPCYTSQKGGFSIVSTHSLPHLANVEANTFLSPKLYKDVVVNVDVIKGSSR